MPRLESGRPRVDSILGLFIVETNVIYVRKHLSSCRQAAIVAHEIAHFFQVKTGGRIDKWGGLGNEVGIFRELEAREIETRFQSAFFQKRILKQTKGASVASDSAAAAGVTVTLIKR
jgi:hypothetical protein